VQDDLDPDPVQVRVLRARQARRGDAREEEALRLGSGRSGAKGRRGGGRDCARAREGVSSALERARRKAERRAGRTDLYLADVVGEAL